MKLIDQITIKADCVGFFLRSLAKSTNDADLIVDVILYPYKPKHQALFDEYRMEVYDDKHPMDRPDKIGKVKDLMPPDECDKYHADVDDEAMRRAMK